MKKNLLLGSIIVLAVFLICSCGNKESQSKPNESLESTSNGAIQEESASNNSLMATSDASIDISNQAIQWGSDSMSSFESIQKATHGINSESAESTLLQNIGKTLNLLKEEHPNAVIQNYDIPDAAVVCFGEPDMNYAFTILGTQDFPFSEYAEEYKEQFKCSGLYTTVGVYFPINKDMTIADFFSSIGVSSYDYFNDEYPGGAGWFCFKFHDMEISIDASEDSYDSNRNFKPATIIKSSYPIAIMDNDMDMQNQKVIDEIDY
ncbi:MAG: hypothetical protein PHC40_07645 [Eubacteriales bacterium]|nr:hypothetical protein [Eubacteriales bacterium]